MALDISSHNGRYFYKFEKWGHRLRECKINKITLDISWEHFGKSLGKNHIGDPVRSYYTRKYLEVLEKASYHLRQARREHGDSV